MCINLNSASADLSVICFLSEGVEDEYQDRSIFHGIYFISYAVNTKGMDI